jgi:co-chaperonin GroES (HSP10)
MSIDPAMLGGAKGTYTVYQADTITPIHDRVLVTDMEFGEQKTAGGIIIPGDDGQARGIHPRWCRVLAKGHENNDDYEVGDWILVEHGRWTRGLKVKMAQEGTITVRAVEAQSVLGVSKTKPDTQLTRKTDSEKPYVAEGK